MLAALLLNLSGGSPPPSEPRAGNRYPWRRSVRHNQDYPEIVDALPEPLAARVESAVESAVVAVKGEKPTEALSAEKTFASILLSVSGIVRDEVREVLKDEKIRKKALREIFIAEVRRRVEEEEELMMVFAFI